MLDRIEKILRHYWHDFYYFITSEPGEKFAMTCKDATEKIDLPDDQKTLKDRFRVLLHVSLCQACSNYKKLSLLLRQMIKRLVVSQKKHPVEIDKLNQSLLKKFEKK